MEKMKYVVGFVFNRDMSRVALIRKKRPQWQSGLLNGIGGKMESDETPVGTMVREFNEEAGSIIANQDWHYFCEMSGINNDGGLFEVHFFYAIGDLWRLVSPTDEEIEIHLTASICSGKEQTVGNIPWLVALAIDFAKGVYPPSLARIEYGGKLRMEVKK